MEICQIAKYQNISDRLKRLANNTNGTTSTLANPSLTLAKSYQSPRVAPYQKYQNFETFRMKNEQKQTISRVPTQQTEKNQDQQGFMINKEKIKIGDLLGKNILEMNNKPVNTDESRLPSFLEKAKVDSDQHSQWKEVGSKKTDRSTLNKVKSESSLKIEEILQSYNNYKLNKQKFIEELQPSQSHTRIISEDFSQELYQAGPLQEDSIIKSHQESQIDRLWNEISPEQEEDEPVSQFKRSPKNPIDYLFEACSQQTKEQQKPMLQPEKRSVSNTGRSKLILKNRTNQIAVNNDKPSVLTTLLSPRGPRMPGKICKNHDRSMITVQL